MRSKSPAATERGVWPTLRIWWFGWNEPSPLPSRTSTAGPAGPAVFRATSSRWSPLKSPTATDSALPVAEAAVLDVGGDSRLERTIAVTQQHTQAALGGGGRKRSLVDDREIRLAVVVEVRHRDRAGMDADRESDRGQKTENRTIFQCFQRQFALLGRPRQRPGLLQQAMQPGQCHEMNPPRKKNARIASRHRFASGLCTGVETIDPRIRPTRSVLPDGRELQRQVAGVRLARAVGPDHAHRDGLC